MDIKSIRKINFNKIVANYGGQSEVAKTLGRTRSQINAICRGRSPIGDNLARTIETGLELEASSLDYSNVGNFDENKSIPLYNLEDALERKQDSIVGYVQTNKLETTFGLSLTTDILSPLYLQGTILIVNETKLPKHGDMVVMIFKIGQEWSKATIRFVIKHKGETAFTLPNSNEIEVHQGYRVLGIVTSVISKVTPPSNLPKPT